MSVLGQNPNERKNVPPSYSSISREEQMFSLTERPSWSERHKVLLIETALFTNVFLSGLDSTISASTYQLIGNEFGDVKLSSWITTAYLITCTSFQPLYGSFSDTLGRRHCLFFANTIFALGCFGCGTTTTIYSLILMRALTGIGGGGLITLSTIINSDIIPAKKRGIYQAFQNVLLGTGAVVGASCGGLIATTMGWRWCFLLQVPISVGGTLVAFFFVHDQRPDINGGVSAVRTTGWEKLEKIDFSGALLLVLGLACQLFFLTLNSTSKSSESYWYSPQSIVLTLSTGVSLILFAYVEHTTKANPIIPHDLLRQAHGATVLIISVLVGFVAYAYIFTLPLYFQVVIGDTAAKAGLRLTVPSFCTPIGGLITGLSMKNPNHLPVLLISGITCMLLGNLCFLFIKPWTPYWQTSLLLVPANVGQGITFPSTLFTFLFAFPPYKQATATSTLYLFRSVGCVWGVAGTSSLIQYAVRNQAKKSLNGLLTEKEIRKLLLQLSHTTSQIKKLPPDVRSAVISSYDNAIRQAYFLSVFLCTIAILLSFLKRVFKKRDEHEGQDSNETENMHIRRESFTSLI
ncbi:MDR family MFS transporter [Lachancea thermotolerans CBS 6340]|uniref:KLTH0E16720p n=1 Tax=Lachancea thermotolerans (strain ATCC 56472 / CBS 6340 / NRRL Y-8284) TaxID=559295 RepID=C5DJ09_LACTC|nr:KLTH0E16720p [Lachancea thermotolerans CBS 6340]CAR23770.1 KLTH0E16720p [Lachancea thermotolerans CBS 6340]